MPSPSSSLPPRATRRFRAEAVPEDAVDEALEAARWTGSARNRQPWRFIVVRHAALRAELSRCGAYAQHLTGAPVVVALAADAGAGADTEFDVGRAAQSLMHAAGRRGLGSCPATFFPDRNVRRAGRLLGVDPPWRVRWAISLGWPAPDDPPIPPGARAGRPAIPTGRLPAATVRRAAPSPPPT